MKFSEFIGESLIIEKNEDKVLAVLKKNMQPALDQAEKMLNDRLDNWGIKKKVDVYSKEKEVAGGYEVEYWLEVPKDFGVGDGRDFSEEAYKAFRDVGRKLDKVFHLPFFARRWNANFGIMEVSGRGPWKVAQIRIKENPNFNRGEASPENINLDKDERGFSALKDMLDDLRLYKDGENILKYANKAGRIAPELVKEAKKLARAIKEFRDRAEAEMKKLASQHPDKEIQRYYS